MNPPFQYCKKKERRKCYEKKMILARVNVKKYILHAIIQEQIRKYKYFYNNIYTLHGIPKIQHIFNT